MLYVSNICGIIKIEQNSTLEFFMKDSFELAKRLAGHDLKRLESILVTALGCFGMDKLINL